MEDINYPTAYALHGITKFTGHSMCGLPIIGTECFVVMPCYITKHIIKLTLKLKCESFFI